MRTYCLTALMLASSGNVQANVPALPCTSNQAMVAALNNAIDNGDLGVAEAFLSDDVIYGGGGFQGKQQVVSAFKRTDWEGPRSRLVFATSETLFFQRRTRTVYEQLVSFACNGKDGKVVAVNMHRRNEWIEAFGERRNLVIDERGEK